MIDFFALIKYFYRIFRDFRSSKLSIVKFSHFITEEVYHETTCGLMKNAAVLAHEQVNKDSNYAVFSLFIRV